MYVYDTMVFLVNVFRREKKEKVGVIVCHTKATNVWNNEAFSWSAARLNTIQYRWDGGQPTAHDHTGQALFYILPAGVNMPQVGVDITPSG
jgi:hypothetical protein